MTLNDKRISTGVKGLDDMLSGGFPEKSILLVSGGPGVGKTIFSLQYTFEAVKRNEPCVYLSLEEPMQKKFWNAKAFGWDLEKAQKENELYILDLMMVPQNKGNVEPVDRKRGKIDDSIENEISKAVHTIDAKHIILDPLTSILIHESRSGKKRFMISELFDTIRNLNCSALITSEGVPRSNDFYMEQFLADGLITLNREILEFQLIKTILIEKMRGIDFDEQPRRYVITSRGLQVFNTEPVIV